MAKTQPEGLFFDNCTGISVEDILPDDDANEAFSKIDRNIVGVECQTDTLEDKPTYTEPTEAIIHNNQYMQLSENNQCAPLAEDDEDKRTTKKSQEWKKKRTGVDIDDYNA